jgi:hypothetical protein
MMSMYQYTSKGYKYVERDDDDIPELWIVVEHGEEPPEDIDPDMDWLFDNFIEAVECANDEASGKSRAFDVWMMSPGQYCAATFFPSERQEAPADD